MNRRSFRSSTRSKTSTISTTSVDSPREKIKDYCRKFIAFMCTQVGVGGLIVGYALIGAFGFTRIESTFKDTTPQQAADLRSAFIDRLYQIAQHHNILNRSAFYADTDSQLALFQRRLVVLVKEGYDGPDSAQLWSFPAALMFSLSIITMIGYGNLVPRTGWGKFATIIYAVFGIPLYVLYFLNMGEVLANCFRWFYTYLYECSTRKRKKRVIVPSTACLWVMAGYVLIGTIMFAEWEKWSYLDSTYFCVTSLCKLGLGDFVPGAASKSGNESKLVINFVYMLFGFGLVAMCYNLMREQIRVKVQEFREDFRQCLEDTRIRFFVCCNRCRKDKKTYYEDY